MASSPSRPHKQQPPPDPSATPARPWRLPLGTRSALAELIALRREDLHALPESAPPAARGRLHLEVGVLLSALPERRLEEAIEEVRQALALLPEDEARPEHAAARLYIGRSLLELALNVLKRDQALRATSLIADAVHHLERAHAIFTEERCMPARVEAARLWSRALSFQGHFEHAYTLLEREQAEHEGELRTWLTLSLAEHAIADPDPARQAQAASILEGYFERAGDAPWGTEEIVMSMLGAAPLNLPRHLVERALAWLETQEQASMGLLISLRTRLYPDQPERCLTPAEEAKLAATMDDKQAFIAQRAHAASLLLHPARKGGAAQQRRAIEMLETWIESPEIDSLQQAWYRNDLAAAIRLSSPRDAALLERAIRHVEAAITVLRPTPDGAVVQCNLAYTLLALLECRAEISSPALLPLVARIEALATELPAANARELLLAAASALMVRAPLLAHPECVEKAGALIGSVIARAPDDADAHRLRYLHAWIRHQQGFASAESVERTLARARALGDVPAPVLPSEELRSVAQALAGNGPLDGLDLEAILAAVAVRPDAVERTLDEVERRLGKADLTLQERRVLLEQGITAATSSAPGDEGARGRRLAAMLERCSPHLAAGEIGHLASAVRGPAAESMLAALQAAGIAVEEAPGPHEPGEADLASRVDKLQARGIALMDSGQKALMGNDRAAARRLFREAHQPLDEAWTLARSLSKGHRAKTQISAGNLRRRLAAVDKANAPALLDEAEALYREAWPWTEGITDLRAQLAKVLAEGLISRYGSGRWREAMELYNTALAGRRSGFLRWETLWAMADAELECPDRPRPANLLASLSRLDEALDHIDPKEHEKRERNAARMLIHLRELAAKHANTQEGSRFADRIATAAPELAKDAWLAARGLGVGMPGASKRSSPPDEYTSALASEFMQTLVQATKTTLDPVTLENFPAHLRGQMREAQALGMLDEDDAYKPNDVEALRKAAEQLQRPASGESTQARAGRIVGRARVLHRLEELGGHVREARIAACVEAEVAARAIEPPALRGTALRELAMAWQHRGPGGDFARSARLLDEALSLLPPAWIHSRADAMSYRARALRYREDVPLQTAIEQAIPAYQEAAELFRKIGAADGIVIALLNLAEALGARQDRPRASALREAIAIEQDAIEVARRAPTPLLPMLLANHAYSLTLFAEAPGVSPDEKERCLHEAGPLFEEAARINTDPVLARTIENNRLNWRAAMAGNSDRDAIRAARRETLRKLDAREQPRDWAIAAHNLADDLFERYREPQDLREALDLFRQALPLRPLASEPQFHWETAGRLGELLAALFRSRRRIALSFFRLTEASARAQAIEALRSALRAARSLGPGAAMVRTAMNLGLLAADVEPSEMPDMTLADEAFAALEEALALAPEDRSTGEAEAEVATAIAQAIALHRAHTAPIQAVTVTGATALAGAAAWEVLYWMLRARGGQHRRLRARMVRPEGVPPETWTRWRLSLRYHDNWDERRETLGEVRHACPAFLAGAPDLRATLAWLQAGDRAAAMLLETSQGWLLGLIAPGDGQQPIAWVVLLRAERPRLGLLELLRKLRAPALAETEVGEAQALAEARAALDGVIRWLQTGVLPDLRERLPEIPSQLLWSPHGVAAGVPLGLAWEDLPSLWTTPCLTLPPPLPADITPDSALLVLAEPTGISPIEGVDDIAHIARQLAPRLRRVDVLLGQEARIGRAVAGHVDMPGLVPEGAPTPDEVIRRLPDHRLIVFLAHGRYDEEQPERSAIALVGPGGSPAELTAEALAATPDLLRRAVVVLLSCETGSAGKLSAAPAGLAGVLLAVGAAAVIAPLWPVRRDSAPRVGERVTRALVSGVEIGRAVQLSVELLRAEFGEEVRRQDPHALGPFVVWTG